MEDQKLDALIRQTIESQSQGKPAVAALHEPYELFAHWLALAEQSEPNDPNAMLLATANQAGVPSCRAVLMRGFGPDQGFCFYTNYQSQKGQELAENPVASGLFYWKTTYRQVRITGKVEKVSAEQSSQYFDRRHLVSRHAAIASKQSRPMAISPWDFFQGVEKAASQDNSPKRPAHWGGYRIVPDCFEFWLGSDLRLHKRLLWVHNPEAPQSPNGKAAWQLEILYP